MDEPQVTQVSVEPTLKAPEQPKKKANNFSKWLSIVLAVLLVLSLGASAWYWQMAEGERNRLMQEKQQLQSELDALKALNTKSEEVAASDLESACADSPSEFMVENIKAALDSKNTAAFSTYTTDPVNYVLAASEYGGNVSPDEAAVSLEYTHSATDPWDFSLPASTINVWKSGFYVDHFDDSTRYIGRAASGMVVSFDFACSGKIDKIFVAADDDLLL